MAAYASRVTDSREPPPAPEPDAPGDPTSMVITVDGGVRVHYLDWGPPPAPAVPSPPLVLIHGIAQTAWSWLPVARRAARDSHVVSVDLRGHGRSDAPRTGHDAVSLAYDVLTVLSGNGWGADVGGPPVVLAGHGVGAMVAATAADVAPRSVAAVALVDGGWESLRDATGLDPAELAAALAEPPEVLASMEAWLADRRSHDPGTWDADQERAARAQVDQKHAGHVALVARPATLRAMITGLDGYEPAAVLSRSTVPAAILVAEPGGADDDSVRERRLALDELLAARRAAGGGAVTVVRFPGVGHNLMRHRAADVTRILEDLQRWAGGTPPAVDPPVSSSPM
jgi:pimeloyl-ACP methyl ester carboxylesterase